METFAQFKLFESIENDAMSNKEIDVKISEIYNDIDNLGVSAKQNAWAVEKYSPKSSKKKDILEAMQDALYEYHVKKTGDWNDIDVKIWKSKFNYPAIKSKMFDALSRENIEFIENFLLPPAIKGAGRAYKLKTTSNYQASMSEISWYKAVRAMEEYISQNNAAGKSAAAQKELLYNELNEKLSDFHATYIESIVERSSDMFDRLKKTYAKINFDKFFNAYKPQRKEMVAKVFKLTDAENEYNANNPYAVNSQEDDRELRSRFGSRLYGLKQHYEENSPVMLKVKEVEKVGMQFDSFKDKQKYLDDVREAAENEYTRCLNIIIDRINKTDMDKSMIEVESISEYDAKAFDIYVTDGSKRFHARSVFCAERSEIVTPHWRFIITNKR